MHRLNGEDSGFLSIELPTQPMTSHFMILLRPPTGDDGQPRPLTMEYLTRHVQARLGELPSFRWRILEVPHGLYHQVAVNDPDFAISRHLHRVVLPAPGSYQQFHRLADEYSGRRLDRSRPLWEMILVDGLADGRQGLVVRFHHALGDGGPTVLIFQRLLTGEDHLPVRPTSDWEPDELPTDRQLSRAARRDLGRSLRRLPRLLGATVRGARAVRALEKETGFVAPATPRDTPACSLNDAFTARRRTANLTPPMAKILAVRRAAGVSVTNVVLAMMAGGLRAYLAEQDDLPDRPLIAGVPMAFPQPGPVREWGNHFINFNTSLATDLADPWERLARIDQVAAGARRAMEAFNGELLCQWADQLPPFLTRRMVRSKVRDLQRDRTKADISVNISVLKGPDHPWVLGPAAVEEYFMEGPPNSGCGVSVTAMSYGQEMSIGISTCADAVADPDRLAQLVEAALDELVTAAALHQPEAVDRAS